MSLGKGLSVVPISDETIDIYMNYVFHIHDTNDMYNLITNNAIENESN